MHRITRCFVLVLLGCLCAGCAKTRTPLVLDRVGPITGRVTRSTGAQEGFLQVFSVTEERNSGDILYYPHTSYSVYTPSGEHVQGVINSAGFIDQQPTVVNLPAGEYVVHARSDRYGMLRVPVLVVAGQLTVLHLEARGWTATQGVPEIDLVRLPDGRAAGRRATLPGTSGQPRPK